MNADGYPICSFVLVIAGISNGNSCLEMFGHGSVGGCFSFLGGGGMKEKLSYLVIQLQCVLVQCVHTLQVSSTCTCVNM